MATNKKIRVAFVKYAGMTLGNVEKYLQQLAASLPKRRFSVDFYYCDSSPYIGSDFIGLLTDPGCEERMKEAGVNLIRFKVGFKNVTVPTHDWVETDFWDKFDESKYDIIQTARAGHSEYPFTKILNTPIVDSVHLPGMLDPQENIAKVIHNCEHNLKYWLEMGGQPGKGLVIYPSVEGLAEPALVEPKNMREELGIKPEDFVFGTFPSAATSTFSEWPIGAVRELQKNANVHFLLLGSSKKHLEQAAGMPNFHNVPWKHEDKAQVAAFLRTLDVYVHGKRGGEEETDLLVQAMAAGLPIVSHAGMNNTHVEIIGKGGHVHSLYEEYVHHCTKLFTDKAFYKFSSDLAEKRYAENFNPVTNTKKLTEIYEAIVADKEVEKMSDDDFWETMYDED